MAELVLDGLTANSWITLDEANIILQTVRDPLIEADFQFDSADIPYLIEAAYTIGSLWAFNGFLAHPTQRLAWPRREVRIETGNFCGNWGDWPQANGWCEWNPDIAYHIQYQNPGYSRWTYLDSNTVPAEIKEAQALLAALMKKNVKLLSDTENNVSQLQLGNLQTTPKNAQYQIGSVKMRCDRWGVFIGHDILGN